MAAPISHLVYAIEYLNKAAPRKSREDFLVGVCFPDIQQISGLTREETHRIFDLLNLDFTGLSDFEAGMKFHAWCDMRRGELLQTKGFFDLGAIRGKHFRAGFFLEESLVWPSYQNWETISNIFKTAEYIDYFEKLSQADWNFWYKHIAEYILQAPTAKTIRKLVKPLPKMMLQVEKIIEDLNEISKDEQLKNILRNVYKEILSQR